MIVIHIQGILESFFEGLRREHTGRKGVFDRARRRQAIRENLGGFPGIGVLRLGLLLSMDNEGSKFTITVEELLEGGLPCTIGREILITL